MRFLATSGSVFAKLLTQPVSAKTTDSQTKAAADAQAERVKQVGTSVRKKSDDLKQTDLNDVLAEDSIGWVIGISLKDRQSKVGDDEGHKYGWYNWDDLEVVENVTNVFSPKLCLRRTVLDYVNRCKQDMSGEGGGAGQQGGVWPRSLRPPRWMVRALGRPPARPADPSAVCAFYLVLTLFE